MYVDRELHVLCLELALHLLSSPSGMLDPLQLPQDPSGERHTFLNDNLLCVHVNQELQPSRVGPPVQITKNAVASSVP